MKSLMTGAAFAAFAACSMTAAGTSGAMAQDAAPTECAEMRPLNIGISVVPPNVVHTTPFVAKALGLFEKYCIDATMMSFEGGSSITAAAAVQQGIAVANVNDTMVANGMQAHQIWGFAPRLPQAYVVTEAIQTPADLAGMRLSAAGGGVGSFNWRMGRALLAEAGLTVDDANFISQGTAGRLPGLLSGQLDGVALHPEDQFLAARDAPTTHVLSVLAEFMPNYVFNTYGAADSMIENDRDLLVDAVTAMIEANRIIYQEPERVIPIMVEETDKEEAAVRHAWEILTTNCVWGVNQGFDPARTDWTMQNSIDIGDVAEADRLSFEELVDTSIADEAVEQAGGRVEINGCSL
jgi:ABC-type nitrate/sulfonate/bicarbonate transport system substrate-binding protein